MAHTLHRRVVALGVLSLLLLTGSAAVPQPVAAQPPSPEAQPLSLDDLGALDALLEEDTEEAVSELDSAAIVDVAALGLLLAFAIFSFVRKSDWLKVVCLVLSVAYLGFVKASLVSVVDVFGALRLSLPAFQDGQAYYLLIVFTLVSAVLWGRFYCGRICAFGALTQLMDRVVPARYRVEPSASLDRRLVYLKYVVLGGAVLYFLASGDTLVYRYIEPFWMFTLNGNAIMWTLLAILLTATVFVRNLYCRYLCSVGAGLGLLSNLTMFRIKRWHACQTCKLCEKTCGWGAIDGPKILVSECVRCDDCERLYADEDRCPHWLIQKRAAARAAKL
ncbi:MAG: 4Fe-4S binding protein [Vicinamibacterales bacterium]|jgi:NosR/NirI family nitrous oxide reductase transcriptional regulator|nr:4Fe-4S binding protein [Vicinamibacterales bacterium]